VPRQSDQQDKKVTSQQTFLAGYCLLTGCYAMLLKLNVLQCSVVGFLQLATT
jgi:hypothetical protein